MAGAGMLGDWKVLKELGSGGQGRVSGRRDRLEVKAVRAVEDGLDCEDNPYKRGNLGATVLKGLGVFNDESVHLHINQLINSVPEEWRDRYLVSSEDLIEADEVKGQFIVSGDSERKPKSRATNDCPKNPNH